MLDSTVTRPACSMADEGIHRVVKAAARQEWLSTRATYSRRSGEPPDRDLDACNPSEQIRLPASLAAAVACRPELAGSPLLPPRPDPRSG